jgi:hypothetical protein
MRPELAACPRETSKVEGFIEGINPGLEHVRERLTCPSTPYLLQLLRFIEND